MITNLKQVNKLKKNPRPIESSNDLKLVERLIKISRVSKVTKGGKKLSFRAIVVIGNENGQVGIGVAKADDVVNAFKKAKTDGKKNLIKFPLTKTVIIAKGLSDEKALTHQKSKAGADAYLSIPFNVAKFESIISSVK